MNKVLVFGPDGERLQPCHPARARELLRKQRARRISGRARIIQLLETASVSRNADDVRP